MLNKYPTIILSAAIVMLTWLPLAAQAGGILTVGHAGSNDNSLSQSVDEIRKWYTFDVSSAGTVPQAITCALEAENYEDAIRNAVSIGGDTDTVACITGGIAEVMFGLPDDIRYTARSYLTDDLIDVVDRFINRVGTSN